MSDLLLFLRRHARANRLANRRLHAAMAPLTRDEFHAPRIAFFPSLAATLNHILAVDIYYIDALQECADMQARYQAFVEADTLAELERRQADSDARLIAVCDALDAHSVQREVPMDRGQRIDRDPAALVLAHLFMHQTHHRGQVHAMLSGSAVKPPQLDEFLLASDARLRVEDMAALGWTEQPLSGGTM